MLAPHFVINPVNFSVWQRLNPTEPGIGIVNDILALSASGWSVMATEKILIFLIQNLDNLRLVNRHSLSHFYHKLHLLNLTALWTSARDISALLPPALQPSSARHIQIPSPRRYRWH
jgi:hypothetical protein